MLEAAASGTLAMPIELKTSKAGKPYAQLSLAIDGGCDEDGKRLTTWLRATVFGETAELLVNSAYKGDKLYAEGRLSLNHWLGSDGTQKTGAQHGMLESRENWRRRNRTEQTQTGARHFRRKPSRAPASRLGTARALRLRRRYSILSEPAPMTDDEIERQIQRSLGELEQRIADNEKKAAYHEISAREFRRLFMTLRNRRNWRSTFAAIEEEIARAENLAREHREIAQQDRQLAERGKITLAYRIAQTPMEGPYH